jgi:hypothetical protein
VHPPWSRRESRGHRRWSAAIESTRVDTILHVDYCVLTGSHIGLRPELLGNGIRTIQNKRESAS